MSALIVAPAIDVRGIRRVYKAKPEPVTALDGVDLEVQPGELFGLLGPNGAGKTTLIKILTTLLLPTDGTARVFGFDVERETKKIRRIMNMVAGGEQSGYGHPHGPRAALDVQPVLRPGGARRLAPGRRADRRGRAGGAAPAAGERPVHRPAPEDELRPRPAQRSVDPVPRRADPRSRRRGRPVRPRADRRLAGRGARPDDPAHDPLHGRGGRAVRTDRHRRSRPDPGDRHAGRAEAAGPARVDLPARARPARRRAGRPGPPARRRQRDRGDGRQRRQGRRRPRQTVEVNLVLADDAALGGVVGALGGLGSRILALRKSEPTLEDVFVELVGRGLRRRGRRGTGSERPAGSGPRPPTSPASPSRRRSDDRPDVRRPAVGRPA